ncbi:uncharacterized protein LOC132558799 [Ylistrum balloti]|uniref:uncharacterized protein LOC132558799 n=1 Tax=Ylistrum balloti TaxID=509963 RepID=UPI002905DF7A|nr:uncharacterized protein LOC132558799 [Ylistrum balloti]
MKTYYTHWISIGRNLWAIVSMVLIPLAWTSDDSFTITGDNCGTFLSLDTRTMNIHWRGAALEDDCTIYVAIYSDTSSNVNNNSLCVRAEVWDITDKHFILTIESGVGHSNRKLFRANEIKENVSYCANEHGILNLRFFTYTKSKSHVYLKISQTSFSTRNYDGQGEPLPTAVYRLLGGIGAIIMVVLLASLILKRRRRARQGHFSRGGLVISQPHHSDETMVALYQPSQNDSCTVTPTSSYNTNTNGYCGPASRPFIPEYTSPQPMKPPEYSENPDNQHSFAQYPDSAPPRYEDVAEERSESNKV